LFPSIDKRFEIHSVESIAFPTAYRNEWKVTAIDQCVDICFRATQKLSRFSDCQESRWKFLLSLWLNHDCFHTNSMDVQSSPRSIWRPWDGLIVLNFEESTGGLH
jgi:hypothetical protein